VPHIGNFPPRAFPKPLSISPGAFLAADDTQDWDITGLRIRNRAALTLQQYFAQICLPQGATVTKLILYAYRDDIQASINVKLQRADRAGGATLMAQALADWTTGYGSVYDDSISDPMIDNEGYCYYLIANIDPNDAVGDVEFTGAVIEWN